MFAEGGGENEHVVPAGDEEGEVGEGGRAVGAQLGGGHRSK